MRDPIAVFRLLETLYSSFDAIAANRSKYASCQCLCYTVLVLHCVGHSPIPFLLYTFFVPDVFKVETVGDTYVAICGLPDPRPNHAVIMARFANDCAAKAKTLLRQLEVELGPDTSALGFRFGLHSGPVTGTIVSIFLM